MLAFGSLKSIYCNLDYIFFPSRNGGHRTCARVAIGRFACGLAVTSLYISTYEGPLPSCQHELRLLRLLG